MISVCLFVSLIVYELNAWTLKILNINNITLVEGTPSHYVTLKTMNHTVICLKYDHMKYAHRQNYTF